MASVSVTGVLDTAATAGLVLTVPSPLSLPLSANSGHLAAARLLLHQLHADRHAGQAPWQVQASGSNNFETITVLGTCYTASQTIIPLALLHPPPPAQGWQVRLYCTAYAPAAPRPTPCNCRWWRTTSSFMTGGGGTADQVDDNGNTLGGILNLAGNGIETGVVALWRWWGNRSHAGERIEDRLPRRYGAAGGG